MLIINAFYDWRVLFRGIMFSWLISFDIRYPIILTFLHESIHLANHTIVSLVYQISDQIFQTFFHDCTIKWNMVVFVLVKWMNWNWWINLVFSTHTWNSISCGKIVICAMPGLPLLCVTWYHFYVRVTTILSISGKRKAVKEYHRGLVLMRLMVSSLCYIN